MNLLRLDRMNADRVVQLLESYRGSLLEHRRLSCASDLLKEVASHLGAYAFSLVGDSHAADVLQETFLAIYKSLDKCKAKTAEKFLAWCRGIMRHKAIDNHRKWGFYTLEHFELDNITEFLLTDVPSEPMSPAKRLDLDYALKLLAESKPDCRNVLWDHYVIGMDYAEIGEQLKETNECIRMRIKRCLDTARGLLE